MQHVSSYCVDLVLVYHIPTQAGDRDMFKGHTVREITLFLVRVWVVCTHIRWWTCMIATCVTVRLDTKLWRTRMFVSCTTVAHMFVPDVCYCEGG